MSVKVPALLRDLRSAYTGKLVKGVTPEKLANLQKWFADHPKDFMAEMRRLEEGYEARVRQVASERAAAGLPAIVEDTTLPEEPVEQLIAELLAAMKG